MSALFLAGVEARFLEPDALARFMQAEETRPGKHFLRFFRPEAFDAARGETTHTGTLAEAAACALSDCVLQVGTPAGGLDVSAEASDAFPARFLELVSVVLDDEGCARRLFDGGVLDRLGAGRHFFGSLPVRTIARWFSRASREAARGLLQGGWDEDLLNLLESAALRAATNAEELLVLVPAWRAAPTADVGPSPADRGLVRSDRSRSFEVAGALEAMMSSGATDVSLIVGQPALFSRHGVRLEVSGGPLSHGELEHAVSTLLEARHRAQLERTGQLVHGFAIRGLGRFQCTALRTVGGLACSIRAFHVEPDLGQLGFAADVTEALRTVSRGLVVVAAPPGQGRTTLVSAWLRALETEALSFDEPTTFADAAFPIRHLEPVTERSRDALLVAARALPLCPIGVDLLDEGLAAELALELAAEGRLVMLALRAQSSAAALHRLAALDAARSRRRLSESLAAVTTFRLLAGTQSVVHAAELLLPTEALRRHLRANDTPAPAALLETEGLSLDDRLLSALRRGLVTEEAARRWLVDARRVAEGASEPTRRDDAS